MLIANYGLIEKFAKKHARSRLSLDIWYQTTLKARWSKFDDVKKTFGSADIYGYCVIFDIAGNRYRLIALIRYDLEQLNIEKILTHAEYDRDSWKKHC
jgi:mRNA interferase HigB